MMTRNIMINRPFSYSRYRTGTSLEEGVNGVNRLATKGEKILLTTDKTKKKLPTSDKKINRDLPTADKGRNF